MDICLTSDDFLPSATGVGVHLSVIAPELVQRGHRVSVVTTRRKRQAAEEEWQGVRILRVPTINLYGFYQALPSADLLRRLLVGHRGLVHHHYAGWLMRTCVGVARELGLPQVSTYHMTADHLTQPLPMRPLRGLIRRAMVRANNACQLVISPSANLMPQLYAMGIRSPIVHITNPVAFNDTKGVEPALRTGSFVVLYAGRLGPEKNVGHLVRAFSLMVRSATSGRLQIAGEGPEAADLRRLCRDLGVSDKVEFLGFLDHPKLARHYAACDVFVLPSRVEIQALVALEAMHFGKPVLVSRSIVSATELVEEGVNGYIVNPSDPAELGSRLLELAYDRSLRERMGAESSRKADAFRPGTVVDALERAYRTVV